MSRVRDTSRHAATLNDIAPFTKAVAVTPNDSTNLSYDTRALYIGGAGNVAVIMADDETNTAVVFSGVPVGAVLDISVKRVRATSTTATNILALR